MADDELQDLRSRVDCRAVLEHAGWTLDGPQSTRNAAKYRGGRAQIVIVTHAGQGWFDPLNDARGDVIALAQHLWGVNIGHARKALRPLAGIEPSILSATRGSNISPIDAPKNWSSARTLIPGSEGWSYLTGPRSIPHGTVTRAVREDAIREGIKGTVWGVHRKQDGAPCGWEMRGPGYKGFSKGGSKAAFHLGDISSASRVVVTESMIDALSLATIEGLPNGTAYVSTGGGFGPETAELLKQQLATTTRLVAGTDRGQGGEILADRLRRLSEQANVAFSRLRPGAKDWNAQIQQPLTNNNSQRIVRTMGEEQAVGRR